MGLDDLVNKGKDAFEKGKAKVDEALRSEKAEDISDQVLDGASDAAKKVLPDNLDDKVDGVRDNVDKAVGNE